MVGSLAEYTKKVEIGDIYKDLGMTQKDSAAKVFYNGEPAKNVSVSKSNTLKIASSSANDKLVANGTNVEVFYNRDDNAVTICVIDTYAGTIGSKETKVADPYVVVEPESTIYDETHTSFNLTASQKKFECDTTAFEEDDVVLFTYSQKENEIESVVKAESVTGTLTQYTLGKKLTLADKEYKYNENSVAFKMGETSMSTKSDYIAYLDQNGLVIYVDEVKFDASKYAFVMYAQSTDSKFGKDQAQLVLSDGTVKTVDTDKDYSNAYDADDLPLLVRVKTNSDGEYKLSGSYESMGVPALENKKLTADGKTVNTDSKTIFVINKNGETAKFNVYTGIKNAPEIVDAADNAKTYVYSKGGVAKVVYITGVSTTNSSKDITFIAGKSASKLNAATDTAAYYVYNAVVKGEVTSVMIMAKADENGNVQSDAKIDNPGDLDNVIWFSTTADSDDIIYKASTTSTKGVDVYSADGVKKVSSDEVIVGTMVNGVKGDGANMSMASDVKVYTINNDGDIEAIDASAIKTNSEASVIYTVEDGEITNLFIPLPKD